jgi:hypothetical protein
MAVGRPASLTLEPTGRPASARTGRHYVLDRAQRNQTVTIAIDRARVAAHVVASVYYATGLHGDQGITFHHHH